MEFKLYDIPHSLKSYVKTIWSVDMNVSEHFGELEQTQSFMVKTGTMICCYRGNEPIRINGKRLAHMSLIGPNTKVYKMSAKGDFSMLGVELFPLVSYMLFKKSFPIIGFFHMSPFEIEDKSFQDLLKKTSVLYSEEKVVESICTFISDKIQSFEDVDPNFNTIRKALLLLKEHQMLNQDELADMCCISKRTLLRLMLKYTGLGFMDYVSVERCCRALYLLRTSKRTIDEISVICGYGDRSCMNRDFRKRGINVPSDIARIASIAPDDFNTFYYSDANLSVK